MASTLCVHDSQKTMNLPQPPYLPAMYMSLFNLPGTNLPLCQGQDIAWRVRNDNNLMKVFVSEWVSSHHKSRDSGFCRLLPQSSRLPPHHIACIDNAWTRWTSHGVQLLSIPVRLMALPLSYCRCSVLPFFVCFFGWTLIFSFRELIFTFLPCNHCGFPIFHLFFPTIHFLMVIGIDCFRIKLVIHFLISCLEFLRWAAQTVGGFLLFFNTFFYIILFFFSFSLCPALHCLCMQLHFICLWYRIICWWMDAWLWFSRFCRHVPCCQLPFVIGISLRQFKRFKTLSTSFFHHHFEQS